MDPICCWWYPKMFHTKIDNIPPRTSSWPKVGNRRFEDKSPWIYIICLIIVIKSASGFDWCQHSNSRRILWAPLPRKKFVKFKAHTYHLLSTKNEKPSSFIHLWMSANHGSPYPCQLSIPLNCSCNALSSPCNRFSSSTITKWTRYGYQWNPLVISSATITF